jgi:hypothetical protein
MIPASSKSSVRGAGHPEYEINQSLLNTTLFAAQ